MMCGIFGYCGTRDAGRVITSGLKKLEYRGYDSWGVAVLEDKIDVYKKVGAIGDVDSNLNLPKALVGIGHTRWATHGGVSTKNAHPHFATDGSFILAQNGIVQNYQELRKFLEQKGWNFETETDTEVIVRLIEDELRKADRLSDAVVKAFRKLSGRNTVIVLEKEGNRIIAVKNGSPLVVGLGEEEYFFASDTLSFSEYTNEVVVMDDFDMVELESGKLSFYDVRTGKPIETERIVLDYSSTNISKEGFDHYMIKEISEQKHTIREAVSYSMQDLEALIDAMKEASCVYTVGAGGASFAADQVAYFLRTFGKIRAIELKAYEVSSFENQFRKGDVIIAISQSGETADTIEALEIARSYGVRIASVVNMLGSTITRMSEFTFLSRSGPEICVISTKSGSAQTAFGYLLAHSLVHKHDIAISNIENLSLSLEKYIDESLFSNIKDISTLLAKKEHIYILGRGQNYNVARIAALNMKEAGYVHAEAFSAGELKHGVIALIEEGTPVIVYISDDEVEEEMVAATSEVKARGAVVIGISNVDNELFDYHVPLPSQGDTASVIANVIPGQLLGYYIALMRGHNPDRPRNLAKSVTVK